MRRGCDLFSGLGAITFAQARLCAVQAFDTNTPAIAALNTAAREASGLKPVSGVRRALFRNPLSATELNAFTAAILDPPREGAEAQCRALASSKVKTVVMISCDAATFSRDAAILAGGGFEVDALIAFDQFRFSPHVEIAAAFRRNADRRSGRW